MMLLEIIIPLFWVLGMLGLGNYLSPDKKTLRLEYFFISAGFLGLFIFFIGLLGLIAPWVFYVITALLVLFSLKALSLIRSFDFNIIRNNVTLTLFIVGFFSWLIISSLAPPTSPDALYFHLGLPKIYAQTGQVRFVPTIIFSASPMTAEMITTGFFSLGLESAAAIFVVITALILLLSAAQNAAKFGGKGDWANALILSVPLFVTTIGDVKNNFLLAGLALLAALKLSEFIRENKVRSLICSAVAAGMACGTKAIGIGFLLAIIILLLWYYFSGRIRFRALAIFVLLSMIVASPWYLYSWISTGNPVYPFFNNIFPSEYWSRVFDDFNSGIAALSGPRDLIGLIISPLQLLFFPEDFRGRMGFALITLFIIAVLYSHKQLRSAPIIAVIIAYYVIWYFGYKWAPYLAPIIPLAAIIASSIGANFDSSHRFLKNVAIVALIVSLLLPLPTIIAQSGSRSKAVLRSEGRIEFLKNFEGYDPNNPASGNRLKQFPYIGCWREIERNSPQGARVGIFSSFWVRAEGYYLDRPYIYLNPSEQRQFDFLSLKSEKDIAAQMTKNGISILVIDHRAFEQFSDTSSWKNSRDFKIISAPVGNLKEYCDENGKVIYQDSLFAAYYFE